jgi:hypothetical protein
MSTPIKPVGLVAKPPAERNYETATPSVNVAGVKAELMAFVDYLGFIHRIVFSKVLVVTSGKDSIHVSGSLHSEGLAVDIRTRELLPDEQALLLHLLAYAGPANHVAVFDERALGAEAHIHLEYHG